MTIQYFPEVSGRIAYEGTESRNPLAFKHYEESRVIGDKTMAEHLRFAVCYWHAFRTTGADPFGAQTIFRKWDDAADPVQRAHDTMDAAFEFMSKLGVPFWCFHDRDIVPDDVPYKEWVRRLEILVKYAAKKQSETGIKLLWGTAGMASNPRYMSGAATNPDPHVFACAGAQVKHALNATHELGGEGYVFWGGREGYETLLNTNMQREREQYARLLWMAVDHSKAIGFKGQLYIEPKPKEPTVHQYDSDAEACLNFLREFGLMPHFKLNIETNHATLAGHTMAHELRVARESGVLGSIDANQGDELIGWDTDQFTSNVSLATAIMYEILKMGGFTTGGLNFDAKIRRQSTDTVDLFHGHIGSMDVFAQGLMAAHAIIADGSVEAFVNERYSGWDSDFGRRLLDRKSTLDDCEQYVLQNGEPVLRSGRQEMLENMVRELSSSACQTVA